MTDASNAAAPKAKRAQYFLDGVRREVEIWVIQWIARKNEKTPADIPQDDDFSAWVKVCLGFATQFNQKSVATPSWHGRRVNTDAFCTEANKGSIRRAIQLLCNTVDPDGADGE